MYQRKIKIYAEGNKAMYRTAYIISAGTGKKLSMWRENDKIFFATQGVCFWWVVLGINMKWIEQIIDILNKILKEDK